MKTSHQTQVLYKAYAKMFTKGSADLDSRENAIRDVESLEGKNRLYYTRMAHKNWFSLSPELIAQLGIPFLSRCGLKELSERFSGWKLVERSPYLIYENDAPPIINHPEGYEVRIVSPADSEAIQDFLNRCSESDIDDALIDIDDPDEEIRMAYFRNVPVGYAGYRIWQEDLGDTGILIHPDHRLRGLGSSLVAEVTAACLKNGRIPMWRTWDGNPGSYKIAINTGYTLKWKVEEYEWANNGN